MHRNLFVRFLCQSGLVPRFQGETCGNARPHRGQACAPGGGNGLPQPGQCVANRIPQWAQNCQCASISRRQSPHSWTKWRNSSWSFRSAASSRLSSDDGCCCSASMVSLPLFRGVGHISVELYLRLVSPAREEEAWYPAPLPTLGHYVDNKSAA